MVWQFQGGLPVVRVENGIVEVIQKFIQLIGLYDDTPESAFRAIICRMR